MTDQSNSAGLSRRAVLGALPVVALPAAALPAMASPVETVAFHARELKQAMDAATSDTGSRWFVGLGGTPGERCSFVQVVRFDRVLDEGTFVERTRHILPREDAGVL